MTDCFKAFACFSLHVSGRFTTKRISRQRLTQRLIFVKVCNFNQLIHMMGLVAAIWHKQRPALQAKAALYRILVNCTGKVRGNWSKFLLLNAERARLLLSPFFHNDSVSGQLCSEYCLFITVIICMKYGFLMLWINFWLQTLLTGSTFAALFRKLYCDGFSKMLEAC